MSGSDSLSNGLRFALLLFLQVFLFRQIGLVFSEKDYLAVLVSPLFIALLPLATPRPLVVLAGFAMGLGTDFFYESLGIHMSAAVFLGYIRRFILGALEPRDGYKVEANSRGRDLSLNWWMTYVALCLLAYCGWYFAMEFFSPVFWRDILLKTVISVPVSWVACMAFVLLARPRV